MWLIVNTKNFSLRTSGLVATQHGSVTIYTPSWLSVISSIESLDNYDRGIAIEVCAKTRQVRFRRDYLGQAILLYTCCNNLLIISDEFSQLVAFRRQQNEPLTISKQALGFYFALGYVPQGYSILSEISVCENARIYRWKQYKITSESRFKPIAIDRSVDYQVLQETIEQSVASATAAVGPVGIWCSGGLDSSIIAYEAAKYRLNVKLFSLTYPPTVISQFGSGEWRFVKKLARSLVKTLTPVELTSDVYHDNVQVMCGLIHTPVIDICVPPKFALAQASCQTILTGEGGDPLFSGVKNNFVLYVKQQLPQLTAGWVYALSHLRFAKILPTLMSDGEALQAFISDYFSDLFERFPGPLIRQLFYLNTFLKQGSLIFAESYYAGLYYKKSIQHPLTSLNVYRTAFQMEDSLKYNYPHGKKALLSIYQQKLPSIIINRKKSGTLIPMAYYLQAISKAWRTLPQLVDEKLLNAAVLSPGFCDEFPLLLYALTILDQWLTTHLASNSLKTSEIPAVVAEG